MGVNAIYLKKGASVPAPASDEVVIIAEADGSLKSMPASGTRSSLGGSGTEAAWYASTLARIQALIPTLTDVVVTDEGGFVGWTVTQSGTGTVVGGGNGSALDLQQGATSGGVGALNAPIKFNANMRTVKSAIAVRVTKIANIATSDLRMANWTDNASSNVQLGISGGTNQTNYAIKVGSAGAVDLGVAQSAVGTYDTLILLNDGTNFYADINGAAAGAPQPVGTAGAVAAWPHIVATAAANANTGFRLDKLMVVMEPAS